MELKTYFAQDRAGNIVPNATISIYLTGTNTLATGLLDVSGAALANPFTATADGKIQFKAADGIYDMQVSYGTQVGPRITIQCLDQAGQVAAAQQAAADAVATKGEIQQILDDAGEQSTLVVLAQPDGVSLVGGSVAYCTTYAAALESSLVGASTLITQGYASAGDGGSSTYVKDGTTGTASTGTESKFYDALGVGWKLTATKAINARQFGIVNDTTNQTVRVQRWLDACASLGLEAYMPKDITAYVVGLVINSSHDYLHFTMEGFFRIFGDGSVQVNKPANLVGVGACFGMFINGVTGITGNMRWHGGRSDKIASEQVHCVGIFGGYGHEVSYDFRECRGDGLYVNHYVGNNPIEVAATGLADGFPTAMSFPKITSVNSEIDGRNAISLIAYKGVKIGSLVSKLHGDGGRVIGYQPGGLDVEPNQYWQSCYNLEVDHFDCIASGSSGGFSLVGKVNTTDPEDTNIRGVWARGKVVTRWYNTAGTHHGMVLASATDVHIDASSEGYTNPAPGNILYGANLSCLKQFNIQLTAKRVVVGAQIGSENLAGANTAICTNGVLDLQTSHTHLGCRAGMLTGVTVNLTGGTFVNLSASDKGMLEMRQASISSTFVPTTQKACRFTVNPAGADSFIAALNYGIRNNITNAVVPTGCIIEASDLSLIPHNPESNQNRVIGISRYRKDRIFGVTDVEGDEPLVGQAIWGPGDIIWNITPETTYAGKRYDGTVWKQFGNLV